MISFDTIRNSLTINDIKFWKPIDFDYFYELQNLRKGTWIWDAKRNVQDKRGAKGWTVIAASEVGRTMDWSVWKTELLIHKTEKPFLETRSRWQRWLQQSWDKSLSDQRALGSRPMFVDWKFSSWRLFWLGAIISYVERESRDKEPRNVASPSYNWCGGKPVTYHLLRPLIIQTTFSQRLGAKSRWHILRSASFN